MQFIESSAKDNTNISEIFDALGHKIKSGLLETEKAPSTNGAISITNRNNNTNKDDCKC